ncbi:hypothetical protein F4680DRAFT_447733 [Xylaria scruposa]|nr:hypothetical protein F4680DRAFT_447733 [Xylaria scruposa]
MTPPQGTTPPQQPPNEIPNSPFKVKTRDDLGRLEVPVYFTVPPQPEKENGFKKIKDLCQSIAQSSGDHSGLFRSDREYPVTIPMIASLTQDNCRDQVEVGFVKQIHKIAHYLAGIVEDGDSNWVSRVYVRLLDYTLIEGVSLAMVTHERMEPDSKPLKGTANPDAKPVHASSATQSDSTSNRGMGPDQQATSISGKIMDWVLALDHPKDGPLQRALDSVINSGRRKPPFSLEVYTESSTVDPLVQLGYWVAGWHKRMTTLRSRVLQRATAHLDEKERKQRQEQAEETLLIPVPLISTRGHMWSLYFPFFVNEPPSISIHGHFELGTTESPKSIRQLMANIMAINKWIVATFSQAMEDWFLPKF